MLQHVFGNTFAEGAFWYADPNTNLFIASLLHMASGGRVSATANIDGLFVRRENGKFLVCHTTLRRLGCTTQELFELLRRTPGAAIEHRHPNAAPLIVPAPREAVHEMLPLYLSPAVFDVEALPPLCLGDELSSELSSSTTTTLDIDGGIDSNLFEDDKYAGSSAIEAIEVDSQSDDIAGELLAVERELAAVATRIQALLDRRCSALGDAPGAGVLFMGSLEKLREQVSFHGGVAEDERDGSLARDFSSLFEFE